MLLHKNDFFTINSFTRSVLVHKRNSKLMLNNEDGSLYILNANEQVTSTDVTLIYTDELLKMYNSNKFKSYKENFKLNLKEHQILTSYFVNKVLPNLLFNKAIFLREEFG